MLSEDDLTNQASKHAVRLVTIVGSRNGHPDRACSVQVDTVGARCRVPALVVIVTLTHIGSRVTERQWHPVSYGISTLGPPPRRRQCISCRAGWGVRFSCTSIISCNLPFCPLIKQAGHVVTDTTPASMGRGDLVLMEMTTPKDSSMYYHYRHYIGFGDQ